MKKIYCVCLSAGILCAEVLEYFAHGKIAVAPILLWVCIMVLLVYMNVNRKQNYRHALQMADCVRELGGHEELEKKLIRGFSHFGDTLPPRGRYSPERKEYEECFKEFMQLDFSSASQSSLELQRKIRKQGKIGSIILTLAVTWFLQILPLSLMIIYNMQNK